MTPDLAPGGGPGHNVWGEKKGAHMQDLEQRIQQLLDQLMKPGISDAEIERINRKIEILKGLDS